MTTKILPFDIHSPFKFLWYSSGSTVLTFTGPFACVPDDITPCSNPNCSLTLQSSSLYKICVPQISEKWAPAPPYHQLASSASTCLPAANSPGFPRRSNHGCALAALCYLHLPLPVDEGGHAEEEAATAQRSRFRLAWFLYCIPKKCGCYIVHSGTTKKEVRKRKENRERMGWEEKQRRQR